MSLGTIRKRPIRRRSVLAIAVVLLSAATALLVASASGVLGGSPSNFEANDGNMLVDTAGNHDWANVGFVHVADAFSSQDDDSFTPGQKQDTSCPDVSGHSNPGKDDFTDVASFSETNGTTGETYLYGATIRYAANGNASENVELKQGKNGDCGNGLLARTAGDKLIAIDYLNGGTNVQFNVLTWVEAGACFVSSHSAPCWGADVQTLSANGAEGLASQAAIAAADNPINGQDLVAGQFAEFGVNLATAGIIPAGTCKAFPQTIWESRASGSSFVSTTKDIAIEDHTITNCGQIIIHKVTSPSPDPLDTTFDYTTTGGLTPAAFSLKNGETQDYGNEVPAGSYSVTEAADSNYTTTVDCSASATSHGSTAVVSGATVSISLKAEDVIECTYTNTLKTGALKISKTSTKGSALAGAVFSVTGPNSYSNSVTTGADGTVCVDDLQLGTYSVQETAAPSGYAIDDTTAHDVAVTAVSTCGDGNEATFSATDTPLTDVSVHAESQAAGGTQSQITCVDASDADIGNSPQPSASTFADPVTVTATGLEPGTYTCTIVIDP